MSESTSPPEKSNTGIYLLGILLLGGAIGGIVYATRTPAETPAPPPPKPTETQAQINNSPPPPPPPKIDEVEDAGTDAPSTAPTGKVSTTTGGGAGGSCSKCGEGEFTPALQSALQAIPGSAQGCYNRALRSSAASGKLTVSVQVGSSGNVCGASIANDTLGSPEIASCVLGRVRGRTFPPPKSGCVVANIPINFQIAQ